MLILVHAILCTPVDKNRYLTRVPRFKFLTGRTETFGGKVQKVLSGTLENEILVHVCQVAIAFGILHRCPLARQYRRTHWLFPSTEPRISWSWYTDARFPLLPFVEANVRDTNIRRPWGRYSGVSVIGRELPRCGCIRFRCCGSRNSWIPLTIMNACFLVCSCSVLCALPLAFLARSSRAPASCP